MSTSAIVLENLSKVYQTGFWMRSFLAVDDLNLSVQEGEAFGFVGPNGAGKTSTIKILVGLQRPSSGNAYLHGISVLDPTSRYRLGFLPERPYFYTHLSAREVLRFYGGLLKMPKKELHTRMEYLLERVNMTAFADVPLGKYSKGMLQRVGLCQTLLHDPQVILLDEPMSGLDPVGRALVRDLILEEKHKGKTVFFCSHVLSDVESICDRVAILIKGKIRSMGSIDELVKDEQPKVQCRFKAPLNFEGSLSLGEELLLDGTLRVTVSKEDLPHLLQTLLHQRAEIIDVLPIRRTLEDVLVDEVQKDLGSSQKKPSEKKSAKEMGVLA